MASERMARPLFRSTLSHLCLVVVSSHYRGTIKRVCKCSSHQLFWNSKQEVSCVSSMKQQLTLRWDLWRLLCHVVGGRDLAAYVGKVILQRWIAILIQGSLLSFSRLLWGFLLCWVCMSLCFCYLCIVSFSKLSSLCYVIWSLSFL